VEEIFQTMDDFKSDIEQSLKKIFVDDILEGIVIAKINGDIIVDIGFQAEGIVPAEELSFDPNFDLDTDIQIEDAIKVLVLKMDDGEGNVLLSKKKADLETAWETLESLYKNNKSVKVKVSQAVKGGVTAYVKGMRGFIPASLLSVDYVKDLNVFVNKELEVKITELNSDQNKIILSAKEVELEKLTQLKREKLSNLEKGEVIEGVVKNLTNFGAFVDLGGIQGLIRNQDLAWKKVKHPSEIVNVGDQVKVYVLDVDKKNEKISLGLKDISQDPWNNVLDKYKVNQIYDGKVTRLADFGAFVALDEGIEGLVHLSELSEERVLKTSDVVSVGDAIKVKLLSVDNNNRKMSLSVKEVQNELNRKDMDAFNNQEEATTDLKNIFGAFLDKVNK
jgi:small subunit ribosomal protein S1